MHNLCATSLSRKPHHSKSCRPSSMTVTCTALSVQKVKQVAWHCSIKTNRSTSTAIHSAIGLVHRSSRTSRAVRKCCITAQQTMSLHSILTIQTAKTVAGLALASTLPTAQTWPTFMPCKSAALAWLARMSCRCMHAWKTLTWQPWKTRLAFVPVAAKPLTHSLLNCRPRATTV